MRTDLTRTYVTAASGQKGARTWSAQIRESLNIAQRKHEMSPVLVQQGSYSSALLEIINMYWSCHGAFKLIEKTEESYTGNDTSYQCTAALCAHPLTLC